MKTTFYLPAYADYYKGDIASFTQEEVDRAVNEFRASVPPDVNLVFITTGEPRFNIDGEMLSSLSGTPEEVKVYREKLRRQTEDTLANFILKIIKILSENTA